MNEWEADFVTDPYDDYNLAVEILCKEEYVAAIKQSIQGLLMTWYPNKNWLDTPVEWLLPLLLESKRSIDGNAQRPRKGSVSMGSWAADIGNDPDDDYNLIMEILFDNEYVATIKRSPNGPTIKWYPNKNELTIPVNWLADILEEAKRSIISYDE